MFILTLLGWCARFTPLPPFQDGGLFGWCGLPDTTHDWPVLALLVPLSLQSLMLVWLRPPCIPTPSRPCWSWGWGWGQATSGYLLPTHAQCTCTPPCHVHWATTHHTHTVVWIGCLCPPHCHFHCRYWRRRCTAQPPLRRTGCCVWVVSGPRTPAPPYHATLHHSACMRAISVDRWG
jgi:hypothetical protein